MVLLSWPYFLVSTQLGEPSVSVETLVLVSVCHQSGDESPFFWVLVVEFNKFLVFFGSPGLHFPLLQVCIFLFYFKFENTSIVIWRSHYRFFHHFINIEEFKWPFINIIYSSFYLYLPILHRCQVVKSSHNFNPLLFSIIFPSFLTIFLKFDKIRAFRSFCPYFLQFNQRKT